jgi:WD40 repeat protein
MRREEISTNQSAAKKPAKSWVWIILVVLIVLCCCVTVIGGGLVYLRNQEQPGQDMFPDGLDELPGVPDVSINTPIPPVETAEPQNNIPSETILVITNSDIWTVNEQTHEANQISYAQLDAPSWNLNEGMSPDKKYFSYITGFSGASANPMLIVLDIINMESVLELELTGPIIQPGREGTLGDPAFEAFGAIQFDHSLAWSPDGTRLAFIAARDGDSADVYLFNPTDTSVSRLSDEDGHAADLHWSPDGQILQYVSVNAFGTGAGFDMEGLWIYDFRIRAPQLLQVLDSDGENFLAWTDNSHFLINSWSLPCESYNLRLVNADRLLSQTIVEGSFSGIAYDPEQKTGYFAVTEFNTEFNYETCPYGDEPMQAGVYIFGEGMTHIVGEIRAKKYEELDVYNFGFIPQGNLLTFYGDEGLQYIYYKTEHGWYGSLEILPEVKGFVPSPSPTGEYWAWASRNKTGLWVTEDNSNPVELSPTFSGVPLWSQGGQTLYYFENDRIFASSAPQFSRGVLVAEIPGAEILGIIK